ncbi:exosome catalytic subunit dis3 [Malassezia cuniculi]|uniref:Ribosomal RNA-processing protein 44 n=1 Tax=Malassezia cuniculi TaxID=948313 RepID=A0AAF0J5M9_9BASI|nr:exosome catalytic subunit dis3 [Malassezia cuniculi]
MAIAIQKRTRGADSGAACVRFHRKTARGKVQTVLRENYLRNDIPCGRVACTECADRYEKEAKTREPALERAGISNTAAPPHYVVIDANVVLHQMDVLESSVFTNVIVLQTVAAEVRNRSLPLYNRLLTLLDDPDRHFWLFFNDFCEEAAVVREPGESPNDKNDRAIRNAVAWYTAHIKADAKDTDATHAVLVTDDKDSLQKARDRGTSAFSVREYIRGFAEHTQLEELLSARESAESAAPSHHVYAEYWPASQLTAGQRSGALAKGVYTANPYNFMQGTVKGEHGSILIHGREAINRAVDGDEVYVEVLPESEWRAAADAVVEAEEAQANDDASDDEGASDDGAHEPEARGAAQPTGRVVGVAKRHWRSYVAHIDRSSVNESALDGLGVQSVFASPVDRRIPRIRIRSRQVAKLLGQKILVALDEWRTTSRYPDGHFVRALGAAESPEAEQESLLLEFDVPYRPFSKAILACLPPEGDSWVVPPAGAPGWRDRTDMRDELVCSIDPPGCQDIDDALHAKRLANGNIEAGVHIADVSHFVRAETAMDAEAASRGTTVYLVDRRIDMLPQLLGTNLCSLRPHVERYAFSVVWELTPEADIVDVRFFKSVIASKGAFTYEAAQNRIDDKSQKDSVTESMRLLNGLAKALKKKRMDAGALNLASPEVRIQLDSAESSAPVDVETKALFETNSLVEEFMLLANTSVARRIYEAYPASAVLRRHGEPPADNFDTLKDILQKRRGLTLDTSSSGALAASLDRCVDDADPAFNTLVRILATRCMLSAEYFASGTVSRTAFAHYGLACDMYTHFTSPIRRYADVLVHRQLAAAIGYEPLPAQLHSKQYVEGVLNVVNKRHRSGQMAGRASVEFYVGRAIAARNAHKGADAMQVGKGSGTLIRADAYVIRTFRNGVAVYVSEFGIEGLVTFSRECDLDADAYTVTVPADASGLARDVTLGIFDRCRVEIGIEKDRSTRRSRTKMALVL